MNRISFDETLKQLELTVSDMKYIDVQNNALFRRACSDIFQNSYTKLVSKNDWDAIPKLAVSGVISAYKKSRGKYKNGSYAKSFKKIYNQTHTVNYSDLEKIYQFVKESELESVVKLLKIQYHHGFKKSISAISR